MQNANHDESKPEFLGTAGEPDTERLVRPVRRETPGNLPSREGKASGAYPMTAAHLTHITNTIIHGDCLKVLPKLSSASVDFILTEPPYLVGYKDRSGRSIPNDDNDKWLLPAFYQMYRVLTNHSFCVSFYGWPNVDLFFTAFRTAGFRIVGHLVFPKRYTSTTRHLRYQHECAYLLAKGYPKAPAYPIGDVIEFVYSGNKLHPTEKPLSALLPLVDTFSAPGSLVLDPFSGSGSTLHAARTLGRNYLGIELDANYHAQAVERLAAVMRLLP